MHSLLIAAALLALAVPRSAGALVLTGEDCPSLERQRAALSEWKRRLNEPEGASEACLCAGGGCSLAVAASAPAFVNEYHGVRARRWGPNCWNAALLSNGILARPRFSSPAEMTFWLASPLCRPLAAGEPARPGDIVAIRDRSGEEVHGFVYVSPELAFSKNLLTAAEPYALQSPEAVYAIFPVPELCREPGSSTSNCAARSDYFRCASWAEHVRSAGGALTAEYLEAEAAVAETEKAVVFLAFDWKPEPAYRGGAGVVLAASREALLPLRALARGRSGLAWSALALRIDALLHQIELI